MGSDLTLSSGRPDTDTDLDSITSSKKKKKHKSKDKERDKEKVRLFLFKVFYWVKEYANTRNTIYLCAALCSAYARSNVFNG